MHFVMPWLNKWIPSSRADEMLQVSGGFFEIAYLACFFLDVIMFYLSNNESWRSYGQHRTHYMSPFYSFMFVAFHVLSKLIIQYYIKITCYMFWPYQMRLILFSYWGISHINCIDKYLQLVALNCLTVAQNSVIADKILSLEIVVAFVLIFLVPVFWSLSFSHS